MQHWCLALHAAYACQHRGDCCSAWQVPAEPHVIEFVRRRQTVSGRPGTFLVSDDEGRGRVRIAHAQGTCVFRAANRCEIHVEAGEMALPVSCRHFPRVILRDPRGTLISLSHYCPTAAALLLRPDAVLDIVAPGPALRVRDPVEGLDAREALPPLVHPRMLADLDGYQAWEQAVVETFASAVPGGRALDLVETATENIRRWKPGHTPLAATVRTTFATAAPSTARRRGRQELDIVRSIYRGDLALDLPRDPENAWEEALPEARSDLQRPVANYLAARAFGNWVAYQGRGLRSIVAWLRACHDVLRAIALTGRPSGCGPLRSDDLVTAIRLTDLVMLHSIDSQAFASAAIALEQT